MARLTTMRVSRTDGTCNVRRSVGRCEFLPHLLTGAATPRSFFVWKLVAELASSIPVVTTFQLTGQWADGILSSPNLSDDWVWPHSTAPGSLHSESNNGPRAENKPVELPFHVSGLLAAVLRRGSHSGPLETVNALESGTPTRSTKALQGY